MVAVTSLAVQMAESEIASIIALLSSCASVAVTIALTEVIFGVAQRR